MPRTIAGFDPVSRVRGLVVEVHARPNAAIPALLDAFKRRLYDRNVRVGLLVTPTSTYVVRDELTGVLYRDSRFVVDEPIPTALLLQRVGVSRPANDDEGLKDQVLLWLEGVAGAWSTYVPVEATAALVPEVVGELAQADFEIWDDVLDVHDAAS